MAQAARVYELERPLDEVWKVYSDLGFWPTWFDSDILISSRYYRFVWRGLPAPGMPIAVEVNGRPKTEWMAKEWDPPQRLRIVGLWPRAATFSLGLTLTRQTDVSTVVDLKLTVQPLNRLAGWLVGDAQLERRLETMARAVHRRLAAQAA